LAPHYQSTHYRLSEQHPREQGLKHSIISIVTLIFLNLSEQHPREQGLKHKLTILTAHNPKLFQSNIQENKD